MIFTEQYTQKLHSETYGWREIIIVKSKESDGMEALKITQCKGEGQGSCKRCNEHGIWNRRWACFLYKVEGMEGCYCWACATKLVEEAESALVEKGGAE